MAQPNYDRVEEIVSNAAAEIKNIILEEAGRLPEFPVIDVGIENEEINVSSGQRYLGLTESRQGIVVYKPDFWDNADYLILLPDGLYRFPCNKFVKTANGKLSNVVDVYPVWVAGRRAHPKDYVRYGTDTLDAIRSRLRMASEAR